VPPASGQNCDDGGGRFLRNAVSLNQYILQKKILLKCV